MKLWYVNFWPDFNKEDNYFTNILRRVTKVEITHQKPDLVIYSVFGPDNAEARFQTKSIFFTGENIVRHEQSKKLQYKGRFKYDLSLSFDPTEEDNVQLPLWVTYLNYKDENNLSYYKRTEQERKCFNKHYYCNFIFSHPAYELSKRTNLFHYLSVDRFVHSAGTYMNNIGGPVKDKKDFIKSFVFTIAYENSYDDYYTTEKIIEPLVMTSIPIYWGGKESLKHFNPNTFVNANDKSYKEIQDETNAILEDKDRLISMCSEPIFNKFPEQFLPETISEKIMSIL